MKINILYIFTKINSKVMVARNIYKSMNLFEHSHYLHYSNFITTLKIVFSYLG
jgi:hypothetical protein